MRKVTLFLFTSLLVFSCKEDEIADSLPQDTERAEITVENGYLFFKDNEAFEKTLQSLRNMNEEDITTWEKKFPDFVSLRSFYKKALHEENKYYDNLVSSGLSEEEIVIKSTSHSDFVEKNREMFLLDESDNIDIDIFNYELSPLVNVHGVVRVGDHIRQHTREYFKVSGNTSPGGAEELMCSTASIPENNIFVSKVEERILQEYTGENLRTSFSNSCQWVGSGRTLITGRVVLRSYDGILGVYRVPCSAGDCESACFLGTCEKIRYGRRSTYEIDAKNEAKRCVFNACTGYIKKETNLEMSGFYEIDGTRTNYDFLERASEYKRTIYSGPEVNFTEGNHLFAAQLSNISQRYFCTVTFRD